MFSRVLVANRGEIAVRIIKACRELNVETVAVYSELDRNAQHVKLADDGICIGPARAEESYMNLDAVLAAAVLKKCDALHPGYGFLSENAQLAKKCEEHGIAFIGPDADALSKAGDKLAMKRIAKELHIPVIPMCDSGIPAERLPYPCVCKRPRGGGGSGVKMIRDRKSMDDYLNAHRSSDFFIEELIEGSKHIEVQILADSNHTVFILGERDCTIQRNQKKFMEEAPAGAGVGPNCLAQARAFTRKLVEAIGYTNAGTAEFLCDAKNNLYFMEFNPRLQVEHGVTEAVTGLDIVKWQLKIATGEALPASSKEAASKGHALECRIYAESFGKIHSFALPPCKNVRYDHALQIGDVVTPHYDPLLAKLIVYGRTRIDAIATTQSILPRIKIEGVSTNIPMIQSILYDEPFRAGTHRTGASLATNHHGRTARIRIADLSEEGTFKEQDCGLTSIDPLGFDGYGEKLHNARTASGECEAVITGTAQLSGKLCELIVFEPAFMMGTMGSAVGEKVARAFEYALEHRLPVISMIASGGARMQEGTVALMQMAKTAVAVSRHSQAGLLYISVIANPMLGGVSASFASLADILIAEPDAVYGFTGKRVIEQTIGEKPPDGFQSAQMALENGMVDLVVEKSELKHTIHAILSMHETDKK